MSRVRILNLPNSVDEQQLKDHLAPHLPRGPRDITDVTVIRNKTNGAVRMAFIGFQNAAVGNRIIEKLDGSYFGAMQMKLSSALGLREAREEKEQAEKSKQEFADKRKLEKDAALGIDSSTSSSSSTAKQQQQQQQLPLRRQRGGDGGEGNNNESENDLLKQQQDQSNLDINERLLEQAQSGGPSWGSELLLPPEQKQTNNDKNNNNKNNNKSNNATKRQLNSKDSDGNDKANDDEQTLDLSSDEAFLRSIQQKGPETNPEDEEEIRKQAALAISNRVHVTNLPYIASVNDLKNFFASKCGHVTEVHIPVTKDTKQSKGVGYIRFASPELAKKAVEYCDGAVFMGRVVRVDLAEDDPYAHLRYAARLAAGDPSLITSTGVSDGTISFREMRDQKRKKADDLGLSWNTTYVGNSAAISMAASKIGVDSSDIINSSRQGAAVRAAVAEAHITNEARKVLGNEGINFDLLNGDRALHTSRSDTTILVKHIHPGTSLNELTAMFARNGPIETVAAPPDVSIALIRFAKGDNASVAFQKLAYKKIKGTPLFLEWAPIGTMNDDVVEEDKYKNIDATFMSKFSNNNSNSINAKSADVQAAEDADALANRSVFTLYVTNLPFGVSEGSFRDFLADCVSKLASHPELITKIALQANKGRAYVTVADPSTESLILSKLDGKSFQGRSLSVQISKSTAATSTADGAGSAAGIATTATKSDAGAVAVAAAAAAADLIALAEHNLNNPNNNNNNNNNRMDASSASSASANVVGGVVCPPGKDPLKLIVKNLPFEATEADLRQLFAAFTEIKSVRVPRRVQKFNQHHTNNHRGFGFVEFLTAEEAVKAKVALGSTHLYGRHLVLEFAEKSAAIE